MKKLLLVFVLIIISMLFCEKVKLLGLPNIRLEPNSKAATTNVVYDVLDTHADYYKVKVLDGKQKDVEGFIYFKYVDEAKNTTTDVWCTLRTGASGKTKKLGIVDPNSKLEILEKRVTWYKIILGWVYKTGVKLIK